MSENEPKAKPPVSKFQVGDRIIIPAHSALGVGVVIGPFEYDPELIRVKFATHQALVLHEEARPAPEEDVTLDGAQG